MRDVVSSRLKGLFPRFLGILLFTLVGCVWRAPIAVAPSLEPISSQYKTFDVVEIKLCRPYLLGFIPLRRNYGVQDLIARVEPDDGTLVRVGLDSIVTYWVIGYTVCHELSGTRTQQAGPAQMLSAPSTLGSAKLTAAVPAPEPGGDSGVLPSTYTTMNIIYSKLGRDRPADDAVYQQDLRAVEAWGQQGLTPSEVIAAAVRGQAKVDAGASISMILEAGMEGVK